MQLPRAPQDTAVMQIPGTFFFFSFFCLFTNLKKSHHNKPKQRHPTCCHVPCAVWWDRYLQADRRDWNPGPQLPEFPSWDPFSPKETRGS